MWLTTLAVVAEPSSRSLDAVFKQLAPPRVQFVFNLHCLVWRIDDFLPVDQPVRGSFRYSYKGLVQEPELFLKLGVAPVRLAPQV